METRNIGSYLHPSAKISHIFQPNCVSGVGVKLTDGEATFGGIRVEILRRKILDMVNKPGERIGWGCGGNPGADGVLRNR